MTKRTGYWQCMVLGALSVAMAACRGSSLWSVANPVNEITESAINSPTGAEQAYVGAQQQFTQAVFGSGSYGEGGNNGGVVLWSELLSDEYTQQYAVALSSVDARYTSLTETSAPQVDERDGDNAIELLVQARSALLLPVPSLVNNEQGANRALAGEALALAGYAELFLAEDFCAGVPLSQAVAGGGILFGQPLTSDSLFRAAEAHFKQALGASYGDTTVAALASVGLGRALVGRGRFDSAAAAVATVRTSFAYYLYGSSESSGGSAPYPLWWNSEYRVRGGAVVIDQLVANNKGNTTNNFVTARDARLALDSLGFTSDGHFNRLVAGLHFPDSIFYWPMKFGSTPAAFVAFPLATGIEARLIQAEDTLQNNGNLVSYLDLLRTEAPSTYINAADSVPALSGDSTTCGGSGDTACVKMFFRERAFWLFGTGTRLGDMRREERQYHLPDASVYPTGLYWHDPVDSATYANEWNGGYSGQPPWTSYGTDVSLSVPTAASGITAINPYLKGGCLAGTSTQTP